MLNRSSKSLTTEQEAYDYALDMLSYRDYSRKDMELKLKRKGAEAEIIKNTVQKLVEYGFLDERRYAQRVFEAWLSKKYYGRSHLRLELQKKNVADRYVNGIIAQLSDTMEEERAENALRSCLKRNPKKYNAETQEGRAAISRFLYTRGFSSKYIQKSINNIHGSIILMDDC
ncbi:regulatory protein RecX [uncultured Phascolarctobacterium sp.]|uniref:regulatory protein RecX n=1 Tax=Phascolarctobacterium sp. TaxID=2049039 RepID=UPI0025EF3CC0|nr:regulatory protein RecX [uncultured Phascolarctobacterium sp.]